MDTIEPIKSVGASTPDLKRVTDVSPVGGASLDSLTERFQALMAQPDAQHEPNGISATLESQERLEKYADNLTDKLMEQGHTLDSHQLAEASRELIRASSIASFRQQAIVSIGQSANKSLQALLKNS